MATRVIRQRAGDVRDTDRVAHVIAVRFRKRYVGWCQHADERRNGVLHPSWIERGEAIVWWCQQLADRVVDVERHVRRSVVQYWCDRRRLRRYGRFGLVSDGRTCPPQCSLSDKSRVRRRRRHVDAAKRNVIVSDLRFGINSKAILRIGKRGRRLVVVQRDSQITVVPVVYFDNIVRRAGMISTSLERANSERALPCKVAVERVLKPTVGRCPRAVLVQRGAGERFIVQGNRAQAVAVADRVGAVPGIDDISVCAIATGQGIIAAAAGQRVIATATVERVCAAASVEVVVALIAREFVIAGSSGHDVVALPAFEMVRAAGPPQHVIASTAVNAVRSGTALDRFPAFGAEDDLVVFRIAGTASQSCRNRLAIVTELAAIDKRPVLVAVDSERLTRIARHLPGEELAAIGKPGIAQLHFTGVRIEAVEATVDVGASEQGAIADKGDRVELRQSVAVSDVGAREIGQRGAIHAGQIHDAGAVGRVRGKRSQFGGPRSNFAALLRRGRRQQRARQVRRQGCGTRTVGVAGAMPDPVEDCVSQRGIERSKQAGDLRTAERQTDVFDRTVVHQWRAAGPAEQRDGTWRRPIGHRAGRWRNGAIGESRPDCLGRHVQPGRNCKGARR